MATLTCISKPEVIGEAKKLAVYRLAFDSSYPTGGEAIDVSADFNAVHAVLWGGNDTLADNGYAYRPVFTYSATPSSINTKISVWWNVDPADGGGADRVDIEFTNTGDLSAVGKCYLVVIGK
jgi:hypothetical protein